MVLSIIIILFIALIAYFHFVQGFFSATISAMIAVLAAVIAVSYDESVVNLLLKGKMADTAHGLVLCVLFAVTYFVLRTIFDSLIPGNVRTPATIDKAGAAIMGIVCGIFVTGIFAIAIQTLPFDPAIGFMGDNRYDVRDNPEVTVPTGGQYQDSKVFEQMQDAVMASDKQKSLLVPVDEWVLATVSHLSEGGSMAGDRTFASVHPDYLQELFGQRVGIQTGGRRVALQYSGHQVVDVTGAFSPASLPCKDGEVKEERPTTYKPIVPLDKDGNGILKPTGDQRILVVRVKVSAGVTDDDDHLFRFSTGSIHLVGKAGDTFKDYFPIGTLENANTLLLDQPDDFLFAKEDSSFDVVFLVDSSLLTGGKESNHIAPESFISVKRFANLDLSGMEVPGRVKPETNVQTIRNPILVTRLKLPPLPAVAAVTSPPPAQTGADPRSADDTSSPQASASTPDVPAAAAPEKLPGKGIAPSIKATLDNSILAPGFHGIGVSTGDASATDSPVAGGSVTFGKAPGAITVAKIDPSASLAKLGEGTTSLTQFFCPTDRSIVQVTIHPYTVGWNWIGQLATLQLLDGNANPYYPSGCYQLASVGDSDALFMRYDFEHHLSANSPDVPPKDDIYLVFLVPHDTDLKSFSVGGRQQDLDSPTHVP